MRPGLRLGPRLGLSLKVVGLDAESNSLWNDDIFEGSHQAKIEALIPNTAFFSIFY